MPSPPVALIVQHEPDGPAGRIGEHLSARGFRLVVHPVMRGGSTVSDEPFPDPASFDVVVALGSKWGVYDEEVIGSWVGREVDMLRRAVHEDVPVLGICFGAQALCTALGGSVEPAPHHEIGWFRYDSDVPDAVAPGPWFTWHGDRCLLPPGVVELARNDLATQAFRHGRTLGVQFHPEVSRDLAAAWVASCPPTYFVERDASADEVLAGFDVHDGDTARRAATLFDWFLDEVAG